MDYIPDGKLHISHPIDDIIYQLIFIKTIELDSDFYELNETTDKFIGNYIDYLMEVDKSLVKEMIRDCLKNGIGDYRNEHQLIYRPPWKVDDLTQEASMAMRFKRRPNDQEYLKKIGVINE